MHECLGEFDSLLHAGRIGFDVTVAAPSPEPGILQNFVSTAESLLRGQPRKLTGIGDVLDGAHAGDMAVLLRHVSDNLPDVGTVVGHVESKDFTPAFRRSYKILGLS